MITTELLLLILAVLLLVSILASKVSDRYGVPALLLFLAIGMLAGSEGLGGIEFDNPILAQGVGVFALALILFSGGLDTDWDDVRPVLREGVALALLGTLATGLVLGLAAHYLLGLTLMEGLLLGSIVSSTDAAAVFSILRSRGVSLKGLLKPLLELESGSNDPMAVFLTISVLQLLTTPGLTPWQVIPNFFIQMGIGALVGIIMARLSVRLINRINLGYDGLYPVLVLGIALLTYGTAGVMRGSGFLAVYVAGLIMTREEFIHRRSILRFFDGMAWLMQIVLFLTLGLLVFPSRMSEIVVPGLLISAVLIFVARPLGVFLTLLPSRMNIREKVFLSWVGLRGAAPIVLATFPFLYNVSHADVFFHLVFFIVLTSVLIQGPSIPIVARWLGLDAPIRLRRGDPIEPSPAGDFPRQLRDLIVPPESSFIGKRILDLGLPEEFLVILIDRDGDYVVPSGATQILSGDRLLVISGEDEYNLVQQALIPNSN